VTIDVAAGCGAAPLELGGVRPVVIQEGLDPHAVGLDGRPPAAGQQQRQRLDRRADRRKITPPQLAEGTKRRAAGGGRRRRGVERVIIEDPRVEGVAHHLEVQLVDAVGGAAGERFDLLGFSVGAIAQVRRPRPVKSLGHDPVPRLDDLRACVLGDRPVGLDAECVEE